MLRTDGWTDGPTDKRMDRRTDKAGCSRVHATKNQILEQLKVNFSLSASETLKLCLCLSWFLLCRSVCVSVSLASFSENLPHFFFLFFLILFFHIICLSLTLYRALCFCLSLTVQKVAYRRFCPYVPLRGHSIGGGPHGLSPTHLHIVAT